MNFNIVCFTSKLNNMNGLYEKYTVLKKNGITESDADYFVLRLDNDPHARVAALAYAESVKSENRSLAFDLHNKVNKYNYLKDDKNS
jgi:hypothetical protein